jgi:hypothetical protein
MPEELKRGAVFARVAEAKMGLGNKNRVIAVRAR